MRLRRRTHEEQPLPEQGHPQPSQGQPQPPQGQPEPQVDDDFLETVDGLWVEFEADLERCRRLTERKHARKLTDKDRAEALAGARELAFFDRSVTLQIMYTVPEGADLSEYFPPGVHHATASLTYALVGLAEQDPEPEQLLTPDELDGLADKYDIQAWRALFRQAHINSDRKREQR